MILLEVAYIAVFTGNDVDMVKGYLVVSIWIVLITVLFPGGDSSLLWESTLKGTFSWLKRGNLCIRLLTLSP